MSEQSDLFSNQIVAPIIAGRLPDGRFAAGNAIHETSDRGRGWAKPSIRLEYLLNESKVGEVLDKVGEKNLRDLNSLDAIVYHKIKAAATGDLSATNFIFDKLEPKSSGPAVVVNANNTISNQTNIAVSATMDMVGDALRVGQDTAPKEPDQG